MPKPLSLKKHASSKAQKSITAFFSDSKVAIIKPSQKITNLEKVESIQSSSQSSLKRKACSPLSQNESNHSGIIPDVTKSNSVSPHKKPKLQRENGAKCLSPVQIKEINTIEDICMKSPEKMSRSPLSSLDNNHEEKVENCAKETKHESPIKIAAILHPTRENGNGGPRKCNVTPTKNIKDKVDLSPLKNGSSKTPLNICEQLDNDMFGDDWDAEDVEENFADELDLSSMQRCEVLSAKHSGSAIELILKNVENKKGTCYIEGVWHDTPLLAGDIVSVVAPRDAAGRHLVNSTSGLLVLRPDHLMSTTSVVAGVFCRRKAVLQEKFRGIDSANHAMSIGILIHELVQDALLNKIDDVTALRKKTKQILEHSTEMLYGAGLSVEEATGNIEAYIQPLADFMKMYVVAKSPPSGKSEWQGVIDSVLDIEENVVCPPLGLKGKIDATLQVTIHDRKGKRKTEVPLELKSGRASGSAEHRGQLLLYCMMLGIRNPTAVSKPPADHALLLYLKDRVDLCAVSGGHPERRDLIMLRNQLVQYLTPSPDDVDPENLTDIEEASNVLSLKLPDPISFENACSKCAYLTVCSIHLWHTTGPTVSESHPLSKLRGQALGHLSSNQIQYFLHWIALLRLEDNGQARTATLSALWTEPPIKRQKRGVCAANLKLKSVEPSGDRFLHVFLNTTVGNGTEDNHRGPQEGEFSIVSIEDKPWVAAGVILVSRPKEIHILLERNLSRRQNNDTLYHIDNYESYASTVQNLTNLGALMDDNDQAQRLRQIIIDKSPAEFDQKLSREVGRLGTKLMRSLNIEQQRAVLKAISAQHYALLQGLPGTGKTQTLSVLIQMLCALRLRVLVSAHTHAAVDTLLARLPPSMKVMRLGSAARASAAMQSRCETTLAAHCRTPEQLAELYNSMEVVGVTCLGANHALLSRTTFDICIVDEATQVLQSTVIRPLLAAKKFVLVGDPEQLPPVVRSRAARRLGMEQSLFHRLADIKGATSTLRLQYRMNEALAELANKVAYDGRLKCANETVRDATMSADVNKIEPLYVSSAPWLLKACSPKQEDAAIFIDMDSRTNSVTSTKSLSNSDEVCVVLAVVDALVKAGVEISDIGIIAPYRDQVSLLRRSVARAFSIPPEASTVDQFQGRDKSVIVYSCTRSDGADGKAVKEGEVLNDQRRLAVSVTRAKHKLIVVGHEQALRRYSAVARMLQACSLVSLQGSDDSVVKKYASFVS